MLASDARYSCMIRYRKQLEMAGVVVAIEPGDTLEVRPRPVASYA